MVVVHGEVRTGERAHPPRVETALGAMKAAPDVDNGSAAEPLDMASLEARSIRPRTLIALRWIVIAAQTAALLFSVLVLDLAPPLWACAACVLAAVVWNLWAIWSDKRRANDEGGSSRRLAERDALAALCFDLAQAAALLALTGGLLNPFALLLAAPPVLAAPVLALRSTALLAGAAIATATVFAVVHPPLRFGDGTVVTADPAAIIGVWAAIIAAIAFQTAASRRVSVEAFNMALALSAARMALERERRVAAVGALSAAAAHELGTPLATIKLVAGELRKELAASPELSEDAALIADQAARCRLILEKLSVEQAPDDIQTRSAPISAVLSEASAKRFGGRAEIIMRVNGLALAEAGTAQPTISRRPEIIHGLRNLIENAADFAASTVWIDVFDRNQALEILIRDDGGGFPAGVLDQLGEPFTTTRGRRGDDRGVGLGLFIAKTLLESSGAQVAFWNQGDPGQAKAGPHPRPTGAVAQVVWPRR